MRDEMSLSDVEPELGAIDAYQGHDEPPFPLVIRGYDRHAVDDYLEAINARLMEYEALELPNVAVKEALERVADDTGGILKTAHETADGIVTRAREQAEQTVVAANEQAELTVTSAEARARQLAIDTDSLWQERMRLIEDARVIAADLNALADDAAARFPAEEPGEEPLEEHESSVVVADAVDEVVEQPTQAFDVAEMLAAEDEAAGAEPATEAEEPHSERPTGDWLDDIKPPPEYE